MSECEHKHTGSCSPAGVYLYVKCMDCGAILNESEDGRRLRAGCPGFKAERYASGSCEHCHHDAQYHCDSLRSRLAEAEYQWKYWMGVADDNGIKSIKARLAEANALLREAREEIDAPCWSRPIAGFQEERSEFLARIDAHLAREQSHE